jgi:hypothetical protein
MTRAILGAALALLAVVSPAVTAPAAPERPYSCRHKVEPDPTATAERCGAELSVPDWHKRGACCRATGS